MQVSQRVDAPLVSVIVLTYNSLRYVDDCILSLKSSSYPKLEIIVLDNNSGDETVPHLRNDYPGIQLIEMRTNLRFALGNNFGISNSHGDLIFLLNADAKVERNCISELVRTALADRRIGVLGCKIFFPNGLLQHAGGTILPSGNTPSLGYQTRDSTEFNLLRDVDWVLGAAMMLKRSALSVIGTFDPIFYFNYEETDLCWRARKAGLRVVYVPTAIAYHVGGHGLGYASLFLKQSSVTFVLKNFKKARVLRWAANEGVGFLLTLKKCSVNRDPVSYRYLRILLSSFYYNFKILPIILERRLGNRRLSD